ncbi:MAG: hypothetical protein PX636_10625 [Microcystis sp. M53598_WE2]|nr:hypothetical protein [Microcystis sp. M53598_WE2]ODV39606.1 hypothetical protein BFG60_0890 [Microcystis aeruginosa NIES-98]
MINSQVMNCFSLHPTPHTPHPTPFDDEPNHSDQNRYFQFDR